MEETAQLVPPRNPGEATLHSPPQTPLSLFAPVAYALQCRPFRSCVFPFFDLKWNYLSYFRLKTELECKKSLSTEN
ncbi:MAG: hypothetical protein HYW48_07625 [Deltaproteobacteria bacterium]|nr:hypothetical protein [Deltaproteobacteria bacterium]